CPALRLRFRNKTRQLSQVLHRPDCDTSSASLQRLKYLLQAHFQPVDFGNNQAYTPSVCASAFCACWPSDKNSILLPLQLLSCARKRRLPRHHRSEKRG